MINGDRMVVKLDKLARLNSIADVSARHMITSNDYIALAVAVEDYIVSPNDDKLDNMKKALNLCYSRLEEFNQERKFLTVWLHQNGNLRYTSDVDEIETDELDNVHSDLLDDLIEVSSKVEELEPSSSNVIQFPFSKKPID